MQQMVVNWYYFCVLYWTAPLARAVRSRYDVRLASECDVMYVVLPHINRLCIVLHFFIINFVLVIYLTWSVDLLVIR